MAQQPAFDWTAPVRLPVAPSDQVIARHTSATGAFAAAGVLGDLGPRYLALLDRVGEATDHQAAEALGVQLSSINSTRARLSRWVLASGRVERVSWARGNRTSERAYWRRRTPAEIAQWDEDQAAQIALPATDVVEVATC